MTRNRLLILVFIITLFAFTFSLTACAPFKPNSAHAGMCNELNSQMIFSGSTSNIQQAEIEGASEGLQQRTYDKRCEQ